MRDRNRRARSLILLTTGLALLVAACTGATMTESPVSPTTEATAPIPPPPPPIAMAASPTAREDRVEYSGPPVVVTGSRVTDAGSAAAPPRSVIPGPRPPIPPRPSPTPQAGLLTAADHDDLLNPDFYSRYVSQQLQRQGAGALPYVDTATVVTVAVSDRRGRPAPFAQVRVERTGASPLTLKTVADGTVVLFPALDRLGDSPRITVTLPGSQAVSRTVRPGADRHVEVRLSGDAPAVEAFDVLLVVDATGSMGDEMAYLKEEIASIMGSLAARHPGVDTRIGLIVYRDVGDEYVVRQFPFTNDVETLRRQLAAQQAGGGGDYPEAVHTAMAEALTYPWRENAVKTIVLVADAPPHDRHIAETWTHALAARDRRIQITPVAASGVGDTAEFVMRAMAAATQSRYLFLTDDSGIGNAHASPEVKCYVVTRLDALLRRVLDGLVSGRRIEPGDQEIIRRVGPYDNGVCRLPTQTPRQ